MCSSDLSKYIEEKYGRMYQNYCEDIFEAFIGACFLDIGYDNTFKLLVYIIENNTDWEYIVVNNENYKNILFRYYQINGLNKPHFKQVSFCNNEYIVSVLNQYEQVLGTGKGNTKKIAEQLSCKMALKDIKS